MTISIFCKNQSVVIWKLIIHTDPSICLFHASPVAESITGEESILINGKSDTTKPFIVLIFCIAAGA